MTTREYTMKGKYGPVALSLVVALGYGAWTALAVAREESQDTDSRVLTGREMRCTLGSEYCGCECVVWTSCPWDPQINACAQGDNLCGIYEMGERHLKFGTGNEYRARYGNGTKQAYEVGVVLCYEYFVARSVWQYNVVCPQGGPANGVPPNAMCIPQEGSWCMECQIGAWVRNVYQSDWMCY